MVALSSLITVVFGCKEARMRKVVRVIGAFVAIFGVLFIAGTLGADENATMAAARFWTQIGIGLVVCVLGGLMLHE